MRAPRSEYLRKPITEYIRRRLGCCAPSHFQGEGAHRRCCGRVDPTKIGATKILGRLSMLRRHCIVAALIAGLSAFSFTSAKAGYPERPIVLIVPFAAG